MLSVFALHVVIAAVAGFILGYVWCEIKDLKDAWKESKK